MTSIKLEMECVIPNVFSAYARQVGSEMEEKENFRSELDMVEG